MAQGRARSLLKHSLMIQLESFHKRYSPEAQGTKLLSLWSLDDDLEQLATSYQFSLENLVRCL